MQPQTSAAYVYLYFIPTLGTPHTSVIRSHSHKFVKKSSLWSSREWLHAGHTSIGLGSTIVNFFRVIRTLTLRGHESFRYILELVNRPHVTDAVSYLSPSGQPRVKHGVMVPVLTMATSRARRGCLCVILRVVRGHNTYNHTMGSGTPLVYF